MKLLVIISCSSGIVSTYIAAEKLKNVASEIGLEIKIETIGELGSDSLITKDDIDKALGLIVASDKEINLERFNKLNVYKCNVKKLIKESRSIISTFLNRGYI